MQKALRQVIKCWNMSGEPKDNDDSKLGIEEQVIGTKGALACY